MAKRDYGILSTDFFTNRKINALSLPSQLLFIYISQGPHSNGIGLYRLPIDYIVSDLRRPIGKLKTQLRKSTINETILVSHWIKELINQGLIAYCTYTEFIYVRDFLDWNPIQNRNVWLGRIKELRQVPKNISLDLEISDLLAKLSQREAELGRTIKESDKSLFNRELQRFGNGYETVSKPLRNGLQVPIPIPIPIPEPLKSIHPPKKPVELTKFVFPLRSGKSYALPRKLLEDLKEAFKMIDVEAELLKCIAWNQSNKPKRKTLTGIPRHINSWLSSATDNAPTNGGVAKQFTNGYEDSGAI